MINRSMTKYLDDLAERHNIPLYWERGPQGMIGVFGPEDIVGSGCTFSEAIRDASAQLTTWETPSDEPPIRCGGCGKSYDATAFTTLLFIGDQDDGDGGWIELRNCPCGNTIGR